MTMLAWVEMDGRSATGIGFVPCRLRPDGSVQAVDAERDEGREVVALLRRTQSTQGPNGRIEGGGPQIGGHASQKLAPLSAHRARPAPAAEDRGRGMTNLDA
jgi:hypothetical protein